MSTSFPDGAPVCRRLEIAVRSFPSANRFVLKTARTIRTDMDGGVHRRLPAFPTLPSLPRRSKAAQTLCNTAQHTILSRTSLYSQFTNPQQ